MSCQARTTDTQCCSRVNKTHHCLSSRLKASANLLLIARSYLLCICIWFFSFIINTAIGGREGWGVMKRTGEEDGSGDSGNGDFVIK